MQELSVARKRRLESEVGRTSLHGGIGQDAEHYWYRWQPFTCVRGRRDRFKASPKEAKTSAFDFTSLRRSTKFGLDELRRRTGVAPMPCVSEELWHEAATNTLHMSSPNRRLTGSGEKIVPTYQHPNFWKEREHKTEPHDVLSRLFRDFFQNLGHSIGIPPTKED